HRIGRTGRAGRTGTAITIAMPSDGKYLAGIEKMLEGPIPRGDAPAVTVDESPAKRTRRRDTADKRTDAPAAEAAPAEQAGQATTPAETEPPAQSHDQP